MPLDNEAVDVSRDAKRSALSRTCTYSSREEENAIVLSRKGNSSKSARWIRFDGDRSIAVHEHLGATSEVQLSLSAPCKAGQIYDEDEVFWIATRPARGQAKSRARTLTIRLFGCRLPSREGLWGTTRGPHHRVVHFFFVSSILVSYKNFL